MVSGITSNQQGLITTVVAEALAIGSFDYRGIAQIEYRHEGPQTRSYRGINSDYKIPDTRLDTH